MISQVQDFSKLLEQWDNAEKAQAIQLLKKSMKSENNTVAVETVGDYVRNAINAGFNNEQIPNYPQDFSQAAKSSFYKEVIREVVNELGAKFKVNETTNAMAKAVWNDVQKSKNLIEFRKLFKLYLTALSDDLYTQEDIVFYTKQIEDLEQSIKDLMYYKQVYSSIFDVVLAEEKEDDKYMLAKSQRDKDNRTVVEALKLKQLGFKENEILVVLGIDKNRFKYLKKKAGTEFIQGVQDLLDKQKQRSDQDFLPTEHSKKEASTLTDEQFFAAIGNGCTSLDDL